MALKTSEVYRCLDRKTLIFGFEIIDLFFVFTLLALLNFFLTGVPCKIIWTWGPSLILAIGIRLMKHGKPDNYLVHLLKFKFSPGEYSCFPPSDTRPRFKKKKGGRI